VLEGVNPGAVSVAPIDANAVSANQLQGDWADVCCYGGGIQQRPPAHLLDTASAGTGKPQLPSRIEADMTLLVPLDEQAVVLSGNGVGDGKGHGLLAIGYWLLAIGYWLLAIGYWLFGK
jgi:hypothetical protein